MKKAMYIIVLIYFSGQILQAQINYPRTNLSKLKFGDFPSLNPNNITPAQWAKLLSDSDKIIQGVTNLLREYANLRQQYGVVSLKNAADGRIAVFPNSSEILDPTAPSNTINHAALQRALEIPFQTLYSQEGITTNILRQLLELQQQTTNIQTHLARLRALHNSSGFTTLGNGVVEATDFLGGDVLGTLLQGTELKFGIEDFGEVTWNGEAFGDMLVDKKLSDLTDFDKGKIFNEIKETNVRYNESLAKIISVLNNLNFKIYFIQEFSNDNTLIELNKFSLEKWSREAGFNFSIFEGALGEENKTKGFNKVGIGSNHLLKYSFSNGEIKWVPFQAGSGDSQGQVFSIGKISGSNVDYKINPLQFKTVRLTPISIDNFNYTSYSFTNNLSLSNYIYKPNPQGVDFRNVHVAALDIDDATKTIRFIFEAEKFNSSNNNQFNYNSKLLKRVFLQAISIPNSKQWVSLDLVNNQPKAVADEVFKKTDIAPIFFKADADMKKDLADFLLGKGAFNNEEVYAKSWLQYFSNRDSQKFFALLQKYGGGLIPNFMIRGIIQPTTLSGGKSNSQVFLKNSSYRLDVDILNLNTLFNHISNSSDRAYINNIWNGYKSTFFNHLNKGQALVENRINNGATSNYKDINSILTPIIAAHWYKQTTDRNKSELRDLINSSSLSSNTTGENLSKSFDQNYFDGLASNNLSNKFFNFKINGIPISGSISLRGGMEMSSLNLGFLNSNTQSNIIEDVSEDLNGQTSNSIVSNNNRDSKLLNAGTINYRLPELQISSVAFNNDNGSVYKNRPVEYFRNEPVIFNGIVTNLGNISAKNISVHCVITNLDITTVPNLKKLKTIKKLDVANVSIIKGVLNIKRPGNYAVDFYLDYYDAINELDETKSNTYTRFFRVLENDNYQGKLCLSDSNYTFDIQKSNVEKYFTAESIYTSDPASNSKFYVREGASVKLYATDKVVFKSGAVIKEGSYLKSKIVSGTKNSKNDNGLLDQKSYDDLVNNYDKKRIFNITEKVLERTKNSELSQEYQDTYNMMFGDSYDSNVIENNPDLINTVQTYKLFPNPVNDILNLKLGKAFEQVDQVSYRILDLQGRVIKSGDLKYRSNENLRLKVDDLNKGIYLLQINDRDQTTKFIKM